MLLCVSFVLRVGDIEMNKIVFNVCLEKLI